MIIAYLEPDWSTSRGREALLDLAYGVPDWSAEAALVALAARAEVDPAMEAEVEEICRALLAQRPDAGHWTLGHAVLSTLLRLPHLDPATRGDVEAELQSLMRIYTEDPPSDELARGRSSCRVSYLADGDKPS
jgi:hypothetical protein